MILLGVVAAIVLFARLGDGPLANYDDCYYAQKAKEMLHGGDWLTPHFAGHVRLDNPPLFLWLVALGFVWFGIGGFGAAFFSAAAGVASILLVVRLARRFGLDDFESWSAGVVLLTTQYFIKYAGHAMMDVVLTLLFLVALDGYWTGIEGRRRGWLQLGLATGCGIFMKSVLGLFPLIVAGIHRLSVRRGAALVEPGLWIATGAALAVGAPWFFYEWRVHPDILLGEHFRWLIWDRGFTEQASAGPANGPFGYFVRIARVYWPWLPFALAGVWLESKLAWNRGEDAGARSVSRLILIWLAVVLGVMSLGHVKKLWYVMSVFPCLALLSARAIGRLIRSDVARSRAMTGSAAVLVALAVLLATTSIGQGSRRQPDLHEMALIARASAPRGAQVVNLDTPYWDVANAFLFYSDRDLTEPVGDPTRVRQLVRGGAWALVAAARVHEVAGADAPGIRIAARAGNWALLAPAP
jgi:4-amino-4-deoxy-L-arabinose transferase